MLIDSFRRFVLALVCTGAFSACWADAYSVDPVHTRIAFRAGHAGFSRALGTFRGATGTLAFDGDDPARLEITVPVATLDLGDDNWNRKVLDGTFFDAAKLPQARFVSTAVAYDAADRRNLHVRGA